MTTADMPPPDLLPAVRLAGPGEADQLRDAVFINQKPPTWDTATRRFHALVAHDLESEDHRALDFDAFTKDWARAAWSELYRKDQYACSWAEQTVLVTFTASHYFNNNTDQPLPPVTHFVRLQSSASARQQALHRALSDVSRWESVRVVGHADTDYPYPALFLGLYLSSPIDPRTLRPVLESHVANCCLAGAEAHTPQTTISTKSQPTHKSELIHTLGSWVPGLESNNGIGAESWARRAVAAILHATRKRAYRFGST